MPDVTTRRRGELLRGVFKILLDLPDGLPAKDVLARLEKSLTPTGYEKSEYPGRPGIRRFEKIVRFATITTVKAGWLVKSKGRWSLTEEGRKASAELPDPEQFAREASRRYRQWTTTQPEKELEATEEEGAGATVTLEEAQEMAWAEIQQHLQRMNPYDFQRLVAALLRAMGYYVAWNAPPGPDKGLDILAFTDPLGSKTPRIKVQVKRHEGKMNVAALRSFLAVLGDEDVGLFVCTGGFTSDAEGEARAQQNRRVTLLGLEELFDLWVQHYEKISEEDKKLLPLRSVYYLAPAD